MHNRMRDTLYVLLSQLAPHTQLTTSIHDTALEPNGLLPSYPTLRPADIALQITAGTLSTFISK